MDKIIIEDENNPLVVFGDEKIIGIRQDSAIVVLNRANIPALVAALSPSVKEADIHKAVDTLARSVHAADPIYADVVITGIREQVENLQKLLKFPPVKEAEEDVKFSKKDMITFAEWFRDLKPEELVTIHPPAGSGAGYGIYRLSTEDILSKFLKITNELFNHGGFSPLKKK